MMLVGTAKIAGENPAGMGRSMVSTGIATQTAPGVADYGRFGLSIVENGSFGPQEILILLDELHPGLVPFMTVKFYK
jgi:hypothetical protein